MKNGILLLLIISFLGCTQHSIKKNNKNLLASGNTTLYDHSNTSRPSLIKQSNEKKNLLTKKTKTIKTYSTTAKLTLENTSNEKALGFWDNFPSPQWFIKDSV